MTDLPYIATAAADLGDRLAVAPVGFRWFSERVDDCLALPVDEALNALRKLIDEAEADKRDGYGPPREDLNRARRRWLDLYERTYGRAA